MNATVEGLVEVARIPRPIPETPVVAPIIGHATYPGDVSKTILGERKGPTWLLEIVEAVEAKYNRRTKKTRVTFALAGHWKPKGGPR